MGLILLLVVSVPLRGMRAGASSIAPAQSGGVTAFDLIIAMNTLRGDVASPAVLSHQPKRHTVCVA